eukprot:COSAG01_NODE_52813_length_344_cov_0.477551_2_plen_24_part_01
MLIRTVVIVAAFHAVAGADEDGAA